MSNKMNSTTMASKEPGPRPSKPLMLHTGRWWQTLILDVALLVAAFLPWYWLYTTI